MPTKGENRTRPQSGGDATGYSVVQDEVIDETAFKGTLDAPDEVQRRADLIGLAI